MIKRDGSPFKIYTPEDLVREAEFALAQVTQWREHEDHSWAAYVHQYSSIADHLIGMLEKSLHGNYGAFDKGQPHTKDMRKRLAWIKKRLCETCEHNWDRRICADIHQPDYFVCTKCGEQK